MKRIYKIAALIIALGMVFLASGCTGSDKLSTQEKRTLIKVIVKKKDADFWTVVKMGAEACGKEFDVDVDFDGPTDENDINGQIKLVDDAIRNRANAIVLAACDYTKLVGIAEKAVDSNIPVIVIDSDIDSDRVSTFIGTDNVDAGRLLGETLVQKMGKECRIAVMSFVKGAASSDQREEGLFAALGNYPSVKLLSTVYSFSNENTAEQLTHELVKKYPDLDAIVATNAYGTVGTARAISKLGKAGKIKIIGFDSTPEEIGFLEKDIVQALIVQNPFSMGYLGVKNAIEALHGKILPKRQNTASKAIDVNNMYEMENQKLLFPFTN